MKTKIGGLAKYSIRVVRPVVVSSSKAQRSAFAKAILASKVFSGMKRPHVRKRRN